MGILEAGPPNLYGMQMKDQIFKNLPRSDGLREIIIIFLVLLVWHSLQK
jgi:hypothetical protein